MGKNIRDHQILALRVGGRLVFTGCTGLGIANEHRTGRAAVDLDGLRRVQALQFSAGVGAHMHLDPAQVAVLDALAARYGWDEQPYPTGWRTEIVPGEQVGIGIEVSDGALVCLPVLGGPGRHECPDATRPLDDLIAEGLDLPGVMGPWALWLSQHRPDQGEIGAVVDALRVGLR